MKISIVVPFYKMPEWRFFLNRCLYSIDTQTFKDYEIVLVNKGKWAENHNAGIRQAQGEYIKFLHMDDWFKDENSLQQIASFKGDWLITGCNNNPIPSWTNDIYLGNNKLGGPSCLMIKNDEPLFFDENLSWMVDCDYYQRLYDRYGSPFILPEINVNIGVHLGQATNILTNELKLKEFEYMKGKYDTRTFSDL